MLQHWQNDALANCLTVKLPDCLTVRLQDSLTEGLLYWASYILVKMLECHTVRLSHCIAFVDLRFAELDPHANVSCQNIRIWPALKKKLLIDLPVLLGFD